MSWEERIQFNKLFGVLDPPTNCLAVGKDSSAAVWWTPAPFQKVERMEPQLPKNDSIWNKNEEEKEPVSLELTGWEVRRFRKDRSNGDGEWQYKGFSTYPVLEQTQIIVLNLTNNYEYRFEVCALNAKGKSVESIPSNPVMVEAPLPSGWHRFFDGNSHKFYYANIKLGKSSWKRPEEDPLFIDESILLNFEEREIAHLKTLFDEDMQHYNYVGVNHMVDILREVGEKCSTSWITNLFKTYSPNNPTKVESWKIFMEIINHIKRSRIRSGSMVTKHVEIATFALSRLKVLTMLGSKKRKLGDWQVEYNQLAERDYYRNMKTGESSWVMPPAIRFYIPHKLEAKLLKVFTFGQLDEFQQYFSLLDVDSSGDLSDREIKILLNALDIELDDDHLATLIKMIDLNGNGTIEFDEFCMMMYEIYRKDKLSAFWEGIRPLASISGVNSEDEEDVKNFNYAAVLDDEQNESGEMAKKSGNFSFNKIKIAISTLTSTANSRFQETKKEALLNEELEDAAAEAAKAGSKWNMKNILFCCNSGSSSAVLPQETPTMNNGKGKKTSDDASALRSSSDSVSQHKSLTERFSNGGNNTEVNSKKVLNVNSSSKRMSMKQGISKKSYVDEEDEEDEELLEKKHSKYCMCG
eukprot:CAMPEP_0170119298 /NCGR_PEP_ID=MMETSP0020_2-20130122/14302_1 /TAXON_ID=98059 /ORGANISM="Dinobryon sp., Strain UTEXLB2267" /LENGTH=636 /DNA_ID=CAMNT_0010348621 /DNA_START=51 /DNA_END=1957 /DNA_ORIENTATION=+